MIYRKRKNNESELPLGRLAEICIRKLDLVMPLGVRNWIKFLET
jgi:hypothetical protein